MCPAGLNLAAIERMQLQGQEWVDRIANLSHRNTWFMEDRQFWLCLGYGICNNTASWEELDPCLQCVYWQLAPKGSVRQSAPAPLRQLDRGFYGMGCPHPGVECLVAQITKLLIHYGCHPGLGLKMSVSMELITELFISAQPLGKSFLKYDSWVTQTWLQSLWEKVDKFDITVEILPLPMEPPQEGNKWFMQAVVEAGCTLAQEMKILNRFHCHQEVVYLSDVFNAGGRCLDRQYLEHWKQDEKWLTLIFPQENPPQGHLQLWRECLYSLALGGRPTQQVGAFKSKGYNIWDWWHDKEASKVYHHKGHAMDIYTPSLVPGYTRCPNCWTRS